LNKLRLSELATQIQHVLQDHFATQSYWVMADVSDHKFYADKESHYFDLVEKDRQSGKLIARMSAVSWSEGSKHIAAFEKSTGQKFTSGIQVLCKVQIDFHISYGMKLRLMDIDVSFTLGELEKQKRETIERLLRECPDFITKQGDQIITKNKGLTIHPVLQRIALIGSKQSAGYGDFMHTLMGNRFGYSFHVDTYHTQVQGEANATLLVEQLIRVFQSKQPYDIVVIIRGGGAETDFLLFNDFYLCKAIAKFPIPIITGIGHLKDQSIADLMANTETNAPTKAAEFIIAHNRRFEEEIMYLQQTVLIRVQQQLSNARRQMNQVQNIVTNVSRELLAGHHKTLSAVSHFICSEPIHILSREREKIQYFRNSLLTFPLRCLKKEQGFVNIYKSMIKVASPADTLKRGFAIIVKDEKIITSGEQLTTGDIIQVELKDSILTVEIKDKTDGRKHDL
jgi:exodeoxyribonuclease VII large subunit